MITKGILKTINYNENSCTVRIPLFETASSTNEVVLPAVFLTQPGTYNGYSEGDIVFIDFENNSLNNPIVLGKLYLGAVKEKESSKKGGLTIADLSVTSSASLPLDTKLVFNASDSTTVSVERDFSTYKSIVDIIKAIHTTETTLEKVTDTQNITNDSFIQRIEVTYLSQLADLEAPLATHEGWSIVIPASKDGYKIWQKTTTYNNKGQILGIPEIICISDLTGTASYWLKCSTKNHAGTQQSPTEAVEITAMIKLGLNLETEDTDATLYYRWSGEEEISANSNKIVLTNNGNFQNKNLIIRAERNGITYLTETILYTPLNTPILRFSKETDSLSYDSYGYNKLNTSDTAHVTATVLLNNEIVPATYAWILEDCTNIAQRPAEPSWDPIEVSGNSITIYHIAETAEQATATCNAIYTDPAGNQQILTKVFSISKNRQGKSLYKIDILNEFSTIPLSYDDKYEDANLTFTEHTVSAFYGDDVLTFTVGNTPNTNSDNKSYYLYIKQISGLTLTKITNQQTSAFTTKVNTITADTGEVIYELYRGNTKVASAKFELSVLRSGTPATNLWLVISHPVHTGSQQSTPITIQPKIQIGNTGIDNNTESYVGYKYKSDETYTKLVWNSDRELFEIPLPYKAENIKIIASQNEDLSDSYEEEEITYSPLNTPVIDLTNDSDDLVYTPGGTKIDKDEIATSTASLWLNGEKIKSDITFKWLLDGCVIQGQEDSETPDIETSGTTTDGDCSIVISKLTKAKATATCIATYNGQEYKKVFSIAKQIQGDASTSYWLKTSTKIHTGATSLDDIEIIAMRKEGTSAETPDTTAHLWYKFRSEQTWRKESDGSTHLININKADLEDDDLIIAATHNNSNSAPLDIDIYDQETITYSPKNTPVIDLTNDSDILPYDADGFIIGNPLAQTTAELYLNGEKINETNLSFSWVDTSTNKNVITFEGETNKSTIKIKAISENTATATCNITIAAKGINGQFANKTYSKDFKIVRQIKGDPTTIYKIVPSTATVTYTKANTYIPANIEFNILESRGINEPTIVDFATIASLDLTTNQDGLEFTKTNSTYSLPSSEIVWPLEVSLIKDNVLIHKETINKVTDGTDGANGQDGADATSYWLKGVEAVHLGSKQATNINIVAVKQTGLNSIEDDKDAILWWTFEGKEDGWEKAVNNYAVRFTVGPEFALANNKDITIFATHNKNFSPTDTTTATDSNIYEWEVITYSPLNTPTLDLNNDSASLNYTSEGTKINDADKVSSTATLYLNGEALTTASYIWYLENCTADIDATDINVTTNNKYLVTNTISINTLGANTSTATCLAFKDKTIAAVIIRNNWEEDSWTRYSTDDNETWTGSTAISVGEYFVVVGRATDSQKLHIILGQAIASNNGEIQGKAISYDEAFTKVFSISKQLQGNKGDDGDAISIRVENAFYASNNYIVNTPDSPDDDTQGYPNDLTAGQWAILSDYPNKTDLEENNNYKLVFHSSRNIRYNETTQDPVETQAWSLPVLYWCRNEDAYNILKTAAGLFGYGQGVYYTPTETITLADETTKNAGEPITQEQATKFVALDPDTNKEKVKLYINANYIKTGAFTVGDENNPLFQAGLEDEKIKLGGFKVKYDSSKGHSLSAIAPLAGDNPSDPETTIIHNTDYRKGNGVTLVSPNYAWNESVGGSPYGTWKSWTFLASRGDGSTTTTSTGFGVTTDGEFYSNKGNIGGFTINSNKLTAGSGSSTITLQSKAASTEFESIYLGNNNPENAPFSVTNTGKLKATSGNIGGFTLTDDCLYTRDQTKFDEIADFSGNYIPSDTNPYWKKFVSDTSIQVTGYRALKSTNQGEDDSGSYLKVKFNQKIPTYPIYIRADSETNWDFVIAGRLNIDVDDLVGSSTPDFESTNDWSSINWAGTTREIDVTPVKETLDDGNSYVKVTYHNIKPNDYIYILYVKDSSTSTGEDTGWVLLPNTETLKTVNKYNLGLGTENSVFISALGLAGTITNQYNDKWNLTIGENFGVSNEGKIFANGGSFTGDISASSCSLDNVRTFNFTGDTFSIGGMTLSNYITNDATTTNKSVTFKIAGGGSSYIGGNTLYMVKVTAGSSTLSTMAETTTLNYKLKSATFSNTGDDGYTIYTTIPFNKDITFPKGTKEVTITAVGGSYGLYGGWKLVEGVFSNGYGTMTQTVKVVDANIETSLLQCSGGFVPIQSGQGKLGTENLRWGDIYGQNIDAAGTVKFTVSGNKYEPVIRLATTNSPNCFWACTVTVDAGWTDISEKTTIPAVLAGKIVSVSLTAKSVNGRTPGSNDKNSSNPINETNFDNRWFVDWSTTGKNIYVYNGLSQSGTACILVAAKI